MTTGRGDLRIEQMTSTVLRRSAVIAFIMTASCAGDFVNHRFDLPGSDAAELNVLDSSGALLKTISDPNTIKAFDSAVDQIDRWFDDIFGASGTPSTQCNWSETRHRLAP